jgi:hypothetical protein
MFVSVWLVFLASGLIMAVFTAVWAARTRQFDDQHRARFIPLNGLTAEELDHKPNGSFRAEYVGLWALLVTGLGALAAGLLLALSHM